MPTVTNFSDVVTQGNTTATGNLTVQGTGISSFTSPLSGVTMAGTLAVTGVTTHASNIVPSVDLVCGIGTAGTRFGNIFSANTNVYTVANLFTANIWSVNVTNISTFQNSVYHFGNTFATGFTQTTGVIIPTTTGISGLGGPSLLFANAFLQTANIGSATAQMAMNVTGNVYVSNSVNVANVLAVTVNASYMNIITSGYANMASINVFTGANATVLTVQTLANVYGTANIVTSNTQTANIVTANVQNLNVSTGANVSYLNVTFVANVNRANLLTTNVQSANIVTANVQNLNVSTGANVSYLNVAFIANVNTANLLTTNVQSANIVTANVQNLNVSTGANVSYLNVSFIANVNTANLLTTNVQSANIVTANVQNLNVSTGANVSYLNVSFIANVNTANLLTTNVQSANIVTANVQNLNVSTGANVSYLNVAFIANVNTANILTMNLQSANIVTANVQNLNVSTGANVSYLNVTFVANVNTANILTANIASANIVTANVSNLNTYSANVTSLFVQTFANILSSNIVSTFSSNVNVAAFANVFTANIYRGNVQSTMNVSGLLSGTLLTGNASALMNINASNVTMGVLPFRNDGAIGLGATAISINGSTGIANQYLSSTGTSLQWVGPPAAIFSQVPTSTNQIFYNSGNVAIGIYNWTQFGVGYNTYPGVPLDVYGGSGSFSNVSDAYQTGTIRIMQNAASWGGNGGLEFKTGTNIAGAGHRIVTTEVTSSSGIAPLIFQYRANTPVWSNAMVIHNGSATPGYVGIGTMTPLFNLHVYQLSNTNPATMTVQMSNTGQSSQLYLSNASGTTTQLYLNGPNLSSDGPANSATLRNNAGDLRLAAASTNPYIYLQNSTSNVGINSSTPTQTLDIQGYTRVGSTTSDTARLILGRAPGTTNFDYASMIESVSTFSTNYQSTLRFYTHGTATTGADPTLAMTINPTQQVGIGIAPSYKFHVDNTSTSGINAVIQASTITAGSTTSMILGKALSTNNSATIVWNHVGEGLATNYLGLGYYGGNNKLCLTASGNVGVGVTNPGDLLHILGTSNPSIRIDAGAAGTSDPRLHFYSGTTFRGRVAYSYAGSYMYYQNDTQDVMRHYNGATGAVVLQPTAGNVGIGITNPGYKLDVNGTTGLSGNVSFFGGNVGTNGFTIENQSSFTRIAMRQWRWYDWGGVGDFIYLASGCVGIRTSQTSSAFEVAGRSYFWGTGLAGGGQNRFTGLLGDSTANGRAQLILNSSYSDMIISSSQANGTHGSTISFVANSTANNDYRKFVINVGGWAGYGSGGYGDRMSFGWQNAAYGNPHDYVSPSNCTLMLDGRNKRVGINNVDSPAYNLDVNGTCNVSGDSRIGGQFTINNGSPTITFQDTDQMTAYWHCNSNLMYLLRGGVNAGYGGWSTVNGVWPVYWDLSNNNAYFGGSINMIGNGTRIQFNSTSSWSGDAGTSFGKLEYHAERWYINAGSNSDRIVQFRRAGSDVSYVDNSGSYIGNGGTFGALVQVNRLRPYSYSYGSGYDTAAIEVREYGLENATGGTENARAPRIGFHWGGRVASQIILEASGRIGIWNNPGNNWEAFASGTYYCTGTITASSDITAYSDIRHKANLKRIENSLEKVKTLNGYTFTRTDEEDKERRYAGVVAQEVLEVLPEVVHTTEKGMYSVAYGNLTALLIESIKELTAKVEKLEKIVAARQ